MPGRCCRGTLAGQLTTLGVATRDYRNVVPIGPDPYAWKGYGECPDAVLIRPAEGPWGEPAPD